jgi:hypothetical protein
MADNELAGAVFGRLSRVQMRESQLVDTLEQLATADAIDQVGAEAFARMSALVASHMAALEELAGLRGSELDGMAPTVRPRDTDCGLSELLEDAITAAASAVVAYGALYAAARLLYEIEVCDLADAHAADWARELAALNDLLAPAVHADLLSEGLTCRCVCPTCGIGACGCTRNSVDTIRGYSGQSQLEPGHGLELRMPPRPGSQLAESGLRARRSDHLGRWPAGSYQRRDPESAARPCDRRVDGDGGRSGRGMPGDPRRPGQRPTVVITARCARKSPDAIGVDDRGAEAGSRRW